ncbi:glycerate kinase [Gluconacetobacter liquefaciens]|uniref:Glycerate kinase n=1 Tax=Gluconacetobacter liquefaciens TaxID=89584 RepID=A0A370G6Q8_GLULI|nr:glycerate kinase [Gluconacetobacter liquefaciens]MBB2185685.1 glycerate kinase [Gluconacetobacter liquefaciens]RDI39492.1 glycerate kinase [Gluconacetobacter liquefaciens]GBQ97701.1 glycerate kinase [Gluconacetobacter liquefaciens NRIC 0522]GEB36132.1 glycerate kinase [Gluconacetobacter liquefaciens]
MKIVIVCDSFKESLSALQVADAIEDGFREIYPDATYVKLPAADGGEGTAESLVLATGGRMLTREVTGPLGTPVMAAFGILGDGQTAVVEMAAAAGLMLVPRDRRDPLTATTYGVGQLILAALDEGCRHVILGLGGSATNDGGAGMAQALGASLRDREEEELAFGGAELARLACIDLSRLDARLAGCRVEVACDVDNPLTGPFGASAVFGPQKGATPEMVGLLDGALAGYARHVAAATGREIDAVPGAGAAGGMGAAALAFLGATLRPGVEIVMEALGLDAILSDADLVITGEGRIDGQTVHGKAPIGVARVARRHGRPVIGIAGSLGHDAAKVHAHGIDAVFSVVNRPCTLEEALAEAATNVRVTARNVAATSAIFRAS